MEIGEKSSFNILNKLLNASLESEPLELACHQLVTGHDGITLEERYNNEEMQLLYDTYFFFLVHFFWS